MIKVGIVLLTTIFSLNIASLGPIVPNDNKSFVIVQELNSHEQEKEIIDCSAGIMSSGSCVSSIGDVCSYYSEWFINKKWESDDDDDSCETDVCESPN